MPALKRWNLDARQTLMLSAVLVLTLLLSLRSLGDSFVFDDNAEILKNNLIAQWSFIWDSFFRDVWWFRSPGSLHPESAYYRPLQNLWFALGYHLFGFDPVGWHLSKISLHLIAVVLSFRAAQLLTRDVRAGLLCALFFAVLPPHAEPVAWISAIPEPVAAVFELGAFCLLLGGEKNWKARFASVVCFAAAIGSFEGAIGFPLLVFGYFVAAPDSEETTLRERLRRVPLAAIEAAPYFAVCAAYLAARYSVMGLTGFRYASGVPVTYATHSLTQLLATLPGVLQFYLAMFIDPWLAGPAHPVPWVEVFGSRQFYLPVVILLALAIIAYAGVRRSPRKNLYLFCGWWFFVTIAPMMNLSGVWDVVQDRYLYLSGFGWCVLAADYLARRLRSPQPLPWAALTVAMVAAYALGFWRVEGFWQNDLTMYVRRIEIFPDSPRWHWALASELDQHHDLKGYRRELEILVKLDPGNPKYHFLLSIEQKRAGQDAKSYREYKKSLAPDVTGM